MIRTQISLTESQMARLRAEALRRGVSIAEVVRNAVDRYLPSDWEDRKRRAKAAIGAVNDLPDASERHDELLADVYAR